MADQQQPVPVVSPFDRKVARYYGPSRNPKDMTVREFIEEMRAVFRLCRVDDNLRGALVMRQLGGVAKREMMQLDAAVRDDVDQLFAQLLNSFDDKTSHGDFLSYFYAREQKRGESIRDFALAVQELLTKAADRAPAAAPLANRENMLRDRLIDGLRDDAVRRQLKREIRLNPAITYMQAKEAAMQLTGEWEAGKKALPEEGTVRLQAANDQIWDEMGASSGPASRLEDLLLNVQRSLDQLSVEHQNRNSKKSDSRRCFNCQKVGHIAKDCRGAPQSSTWTGKCFRCGRKGHTWRKCKAKVTSPQGVSTTPPAPN
ncbi:PREDICTED: uncharacterized protein LOC109476702 [Branchiostoma belcheri]|uniref:Uncharacterized protein LOC109476702 n=1 Tax=Branchiostoma belcheri TaxID=7741 RepID=A0A6P4YV73_BRABE|nr:PREDICTED: uncharacterized protein LOC109476702 [Branchiostoma belcheri]